MYVYDVLDPENGVFTRRKTNYPLVRELPEPRWIKIGTVTNIHMYPIVTGKACDADECQITFDDVYMFKKGELIIWDRLVWNWNICFLNKLSTIIPLII